MRWFTRERHEASLSDADFEHAMHDHAAHLADLMPRLPAEVQAVAELNLLDRQVQEWAIDEAGFAWRLLVGDLQRGCRSRRSPIATQN